LAVIPRGLLLTGTGKTFKALAGEAKASFGLEDFVEMFVG
jgi:ATP-dependent Zn protease